MVTCWGATLAVMSAATNFKGLLTARFFVCYLRLIRMLADQFAQLGGFESSVMASFVLIGQIWYRRQEQGFRIAGGKPFHACGTILNYNSTVWYSNNGWGNIFGSLIVYGLGHIKSRLLHTYQIIFMLLGLFTFFIGILSYAFQAHDYS